MLFVLLIEPFPFRMYKISLAHQTRQLTDVADGQAQGVHFRQLLLRRCSGGGADCPRRNPGAETVERGVHRPHPSSFSHVRRLALVRLRRRRRRRRRIVGGGRGQPPSYLSSSTLTSTTVDVVVQNVIDVTHDFDGVRLGRDSFVKLLLLSLLRLRLSLIRLVMFKNKKRMIYMADVHLLNIRPVDEMPYVLRNVAVVVAMTSVTFTSGSGYAAIECWRRRNETVIDGYRVDEKSRRC